MILLLSALFIFPTAQAWDNHQLIMEKILAGSGAADRAYLNQKIKIPCIDDEQNELARLGTELQINTAKVPAFSASKCGKKNGLELTLRSLITSNFVDEPDLGMDQNLPASADPSGSRAWMGGTEGPTSQGFRHMVFPGFKWGSPLSTFQIPFHSVGESLERIIKMRAVSDHYFKEKNYFWGVRTLMWELHYLEDLHQPFHSTQIPNLKMIPWSHLFSHFVAQATHAMANYHYAYEGLTLEMLRESNEGSLQECLQGSAISEMKSPDELMIVPHEKAQALGLRLMEVFGDYPKSESVNLPEGIGQIDYFSLLRGQEVKLSPEEEATLTSAERREMKKSTQVIESMSGLKQISCELMKAMTGFVWGEMDRNLVLLNQSISSKTGK